MQIRTNIQNTICLAMVFFLPIATTQAQDTLSSRIDRAAKKAINNDLDPSLIESEEIDAPQQEFNQLPQSTTPVQPRPVTNNNNNQFNNFVKPKTTNQSNTFQSSNSFNQSNQSTGNNRFGNQNTFNQRNNKSQLPTNNIGNTGFKSNQIVNNHVNSRVDNNTYETKSTPTIQTQIIAPRTTNINQTARFFVQAQNIGTANVSNFKLIATLPPHAKFVGSNPQPSNVSGQQYEFTFHSLNPRSKQTVQLDISPTEKLPLNISTQVQIESQQQVAVTVQQPVLQVAVQGPDAIQTGKNFTHEVTVTNVGDGVAESVRISTQRPSELEIGSKNQKTLVPRLLPGQSAKFELSSFAVAPGNTDVVFQVSATGAEQKQAKTPIRIIRPELGVQVLGPSQNYLGREGIYTIQLQNTSEMPITGVNVQLKVPKGLKIDTISQQAKIDKNTGQLSWNFNNIPGNQQQVIQFRAKSTQVGTQFCQVSVQTKETASRQMSLKTQILGRADLSIRVTDTGAPVGIGSKSEFFVEVANYGSINAEGVQVRVELPSALMPVNQPGYTIDPSGNFISFDNISVEAGKRQTLKFKVVAVTQGEHVVRGTVTQQGSVQSISSENSIFVFETENAKVSGALVPEIRR